MTNFERIKQMSVEKFAELYNEQELFEPHDVCSLCEDESLCANCGVTYIANSLEVEQLKKSRNKAFAKYLNSEAEVQENEN